MTNRLTFKRDHRGEFIAENVQQIADQLKTNRGLAARVPNAVREYAADRLIAETWKLHAKNPALQFFECALRVSRDKSLAHLLYLDRLEPMGAGANDLDAVVEGSR